MARGGKCPAMTNDPGLRVSYEQQQTVLVALGEPPRRCTVRFYEEDSATDARMRGRLPAGMKLPPGMAPPTAPTA